MKKTLIVAISVGAVILGCGPSGSSDVVDQDVGVDVAADVVWDATVDVATDTGRDSGGEPDVTADVAVDAVMDVVPDTTSDVQIQCPGNAGCECLQNSECFSLFCIETSGRKVCSNACDDEDSCPRGWSCSQVSSAGDTVYICIDPFARACRPCVEDSDCQPPVGAGTGVYDCIPYGPDGAYCGNGCVTDSDCKDGYACVDNPDGVGLRCMAESGTCECTQNYIDQGYLTECYIENELGTCFGTRTCDGECDAVPAIVETCNLFDDDCDGQTDEGISGSACTKESEFGTCSGTATCVNGVFSCSAQDPRRESCDGVDNDCDGSTDEDASNCTNFYLDGDDDGFGLTADFQCLCQAFEDYSTTKKGDCNDGDVNVYPGVAERCNGKDDNCDGQTDEQGALNCIEYFLDVDDDTWGASQDKLCLCGPSGDYTAVKGGDCNDADPLISGGGTESCNGIDDDCDALTDEENADGCVEWYKDLDDDTFGSSLEHKCLCAGTSVYKVDIGGDCNDGNAAVNPAVSESCDTIDNDCDGQTDEEGALECSSHYYDNDGDQYGVGTPKCLCSGSGKYTALQTGDCNDSDGAANPGMTEVCNSKDDDCDGSTDEAGATGCTNFFLDTDRDNYGVTANFACLCAVTGDFRATIGGDCNDADENINPSKTEKCDGVDNDCDSATDEDGASGCTGYYMDSDRDGYGDVTKHRCMCLPLDGTYDSTNASDCCDIDANAFPGQMGYFGSPTQCAIEGKAYDFNCSGANEVQSTASGDCSTFVAGCDAEPEGWADAVPGCGVSANWIYDCKSAFLTCDEKYETRIQGCR